MTRVDELIGTIADLMGELAADRLQKFNHPKWEPSMKGLEEGGDDTFFDYNFNGLRTIANIANLLACFQSDDFCDGWKPANKANLKQTLKCVAQELHMEQDVYFQDCIGRKAEATFTKLYKLAGLEPVL